MKDYPSTCPIDPMDACEAAMMGFPPAECPVQHAFASGFYIRQIFMPAGTLIASKIHRTRHPFFISKGKVSVWMNGEVKVLEAPHVGITEPGTRRLLFIHQDCTWTTFHQNDDEGQDVEAIEKRIIQPHMNELLKIEHSEMQKFFHYLSELDSTNFSPRTS